MSNTYEYRALSALRERPKGPLWRHWDTKGLIQHTHVMLARTSQTNGTANNDQPERFART